MLSRHKEKPLRHVLFGDDCLLLVSFNNSRACASHKTPQRTHGAAGAHHALVCCLAHCGHTRIRQRKQIGLFVVALIDYKNLQLFCFLLLLFCYLFDVLTP